MVRRIDLNDWVLSGGGGAGVSYFHKTDLDLILKVDNREASLEEVETGLATARIVYGLGIPTPEPGEVVFDGQRYGQIFRRIQNKISYARLIGQHPEMIPQLSHDFVTIVKRLHSTIGKGSGLRDIKDVYGDFIQANPFRTDELKAKAIGLLRSLPDAPTCVHGDLHYGNLIKAGDENYLIDIASFSYGHPYFDIAMMMAIRNLSQDDTEFYQELFHNTAAQCKEFWECFIKEYFGPDVTEEEVEEKIMPFLCVRMLTMEAETGKPLPPHAINPALDYIMR